MLSWSCEKTRLLLHLPQRSLPLFSMQSSSCVIQLTSSLPMAPSNHFAAHLFGLSSLETLQSTLSLFAGITSFLHISWKHNHQWLHIYTQHFKRFGIFFIPSFSLQLSCLCDDSKFKAKPKKRKGTIQRKWKKNLGAQANQVKSFGPAAPTV